MIRILQTGDLHLGKYFYGVSLLQDQKNVLDQIISILSKNYNTKDEYNALIITGDVFDKTVPPADAVELFDSFLTQLHNQFAQLPVFIISGNHDSATRLSYCAKFLSAQNIYLVTNPEDCTKPVIIQGSEKERIAIYQIPFLNSGSLTDNSEKRLSSQQELLSEAINRITSFHQSNSETKDLKAILNAHLFTLGGISSESERVFIGNAELVDKSLFSFFTYTALGHLHKSQKVSDSCFYAGSPLAYSFDEANTEKSFLNIQINLSTLFPEIEVQTIPILPLHKVTKLSGNFEKFYSLTDETKKEIEKYKNDFIEITCTDNILIENPAALLRKNFPNLLSIKQEILFKSSKTESIQKKRELLENSNDIQITQIFDSFINDVEPQTSEKDWLDCKNIFEETSKQIEQEQ